MIYDKDIRGYGEEYICKKFAWLGFVGARKFKQVGFKFNKSQLHEGK